LVVQGYDTCKFIVGPQVGGFTERKPLCEALAEAPTGN